MGKIEFVGIINDFFNTDLETETSIEIPKNAHFIEEEHWIDMSNPLNWFLISIPIVVVILVVMFLKQKRNGIFNKDIRKEYMENNKITGAKRILLTGLKRIFIVFLIFFVGTLLIIPIHELLHCIAGALVGLNMKFGIDPQSFVAFAFTEDSLSKIQFLFMSLTPLIILGIIPLLIIFIKYPKGKIGFIQGMKYWILTCFIGGMIMYCSPDMIQSFNFIKNIPSNSIVEENYWYIPNE